MAEIDRILALLDHPFNMVVLGGVFYFTLKWSILRNKSPEVKFWADQKDEILVTIIASLLFLIFDDEVIQLYYEDLISQ